jgi:hypothetical protein
MSLIFATQLTAVGTAILAVFAVVTGVFAFLAFRKQSQEVRAIERQVHDQEELTRQQAELLKVQSGQLELQRQQMDNQRQANARQAEVLSLQAIELRESLEQRQRDADERRRGQAANVTAWFHQATETAQSTRSAPPTPAPWGARIRNASDLPIFDVRTFFHYIQETQPGGDWAPVMRGATMEKLRVFPPDTDCFVEIPEDVRNQIDEVSDSIYVVSIEFTDAAGNHWERDPRGALIPRS